MDKVWIVLIMVFSITFSGCAGTPSRIEAYYGTSFKHAIDNQILNPEAFNNLEPQRGLDGEAARIAVKRYREGFEKAAEAPPMIAVGTVGR